MGERSRYAAVLLAVVLSGVAACSSEDPAAGADDEAEPAESLTILVSNDDGVDAAGIDVLVNALSDLPDTEVIVVAPAEQKSGSGGSTTPGGVQVEAAATASGVPATAVQGFPADAVAWALDGGIQTTPHLLIAGINAGQNLGSIGDQHSGTIGAARVATARGLPALAVSSGLAEEFDHEAAVPFLLDWVEEHRDALLAGDLAGEDPLLENLNVPSCPSGEVRGLVEVPMASVPDDAVTLQDCSSTAEGATDDITAFNEGFATLSSVALEPAA